MSATTNLNLAIYPPESWSTTKYRDFVIGLAGEGQDSNMQKIDSAIATLQTGLNGKANTVHTHTLDSLGAAAASHSHVGADISSQLVFALTASSWAGTASPYSQTVAVLGVTADMNGYVGIADSATDEQWAAAVKAQLRKTSQDAGTITVKAYGDKPTVDIPCVITVLGVAV